MSGYRGLMRGLSLWIAAHGAALVSLPLLLEPGLRPTAALAERAAYVAAHPWLWRLGWLPWQLSAVSDLWVSFALFSWCRRRERGVGAAAVALGSMLFAVVPDQWGEAVLVSRYITSAAAGGEAFGALERWALLMTGTCGNGGYVAMTGAWIVALRQGTTRYTRTMTAVGGVALGLLAVSAGVVFSATRTPALAGMSWVVPLNGLGFVLLFVWGLLAAATAGALEDAGSSTAHVLRWPRPSAWREGIGNAVGLRDVLRPVPWLDLASDIRDVVYLNWMVPAERVRHLLPSPLELHVIDGLTAVSILTYVHGGFGPAWLGPLREALPSPVQSNWRLYVEPPDEHAPAKRDAIYFFSTSLGSAPHVLGSRLMADGLPAHLPLSLRHARDGQRVTTTLDPGEGSAADLSATVIEGDDETLPGAFARCFASWDDAVGYLVEQNRAVGVVERHAAVIESRIDIPIAVADVRPARVEALTSRYLAAIVEGCEPLAFVVPAVPFRALGERTVARK